MAHGDDLSDLSEERPLPDPMDLSFARPAKRCDCPVPRRDEDTCHRCGRTLPGVTMPSSQGTYGFSTTGSETAAHLTARREPICAPEPDGPWEAPHPPRVAAFVPYLDEDDPGAFMTRDGGWIRSAQRTCPTPVASVDHLQYLERDFGERINESVK